LQKQAIVLALAPFACGCVPFGDCWPPVTANVRVSPQFSDQLSSPVVVAGVPRIYDADVTGVDAQGVPVTQRGLAPFASGTAGGAAHAVTLSFRGYPYPMWYVAYLDLNENRSLDTGEPFGVDPLNPRDTHCDAHTTTIQINAPRTASLVGAPSNKRLQPTPNSSFQSIRGTVLAAGTVPQR